MCIEQRCQDLYEKTYIVHNGPVYITLGWWILFLRVFFVVVGIRRSIFLKEILYVNFLQVFKNIFKVFFLGERKVWGRLEQLKQLTSHFKFKFFLLWVYTSYITCFTNHNHDDGVAPMIMPEGSFFFTRSCKNFFQAGKLYYCTCIIIIVNGCARKPS